MLSTERKNNESTNAVILTILETMNIAMADPKVLKKIVSEIYGLSESEQKRADEGRQYIEKYDSLLAQDSQRKKELDKGFAELEKGREDFKSSNLALDERAQNQNKREILLKQNESRQASLTKEHQQRELELQDKLSKFAKEKAEFEVEKAEVKEMKEDYQGKINKLKGVIDE